jgi:hypothetical protein
MGVANKRTVFGAITLLIAFAAATLFVAFQPDAQAAQKPKADFQIDVFVTGTLASDVVRTIEKVAAASQHPRSLTPAFNVDSFFDITYSNIGSSGLDGIRASSFTVDSFFDIEYQIKGNDTGYWDPDFDVAAAEQVFAAVSAAVQGSTGGQSKHEFYGHVSILR